MSDHQGGFEPARYLTKVNGGDYLEVKWRLVWLRQEMPDASIETELVDHDGNRAVMRARITLPTGGSATGYGSEDQGSFHNYIEKAETKAIGRALGALGYGTQFTYDFEEHGIEGIADSPVTPPQVVRMPPRQAPPPPGQQRQYDNSLPPVDPNFHLVQGPVQPGAEITEKQVNLVLSLADKLNIRDPELQTMAGGDVRRLNRRQASDLIGQLRAREAALGPVR